MNQVVAWTGDDEAYRREQERIALQERFAHYVHALESEAERRVGRRREIEDRWLRNLRQYHGVYESDVLAELSKSKSKSKLFINVTRSKTNAAEARLSDMLFPTDDKNWGIKPTPVPELTAELSEKESVAKGMIDRANQVMAVAENNGNPEQIAAAKVQAAEMATKAQEPAGRAAELRAIMEAAKKACEGMDREIDDQLRECLFNVQCRDVIRDACQIGTGVMKGPVRSQEVKQRWTQTTDPTTGAKMFQLNPVNDRRPVYYRVNPWAFFPDPDACTMKESEDTYERHLMRPKDLRRLAKLPGFNKDAIRELLGSKPTQSTPTYLTELRQINETNNTSATQMYHVWEYYGAISAEGLISIASAVGKQDLAAAYAEADPLNEINVCIWFCQGKMLKIAEHSLDSGECIYSVFNYEKDDASIFGYGVPQVMADSQSALNAAWRMMMDNAGLSTGPQILLHTEMIEPVDGNWELAPRKLWLLKQPLKTGEFAMQTFEINSHQAELMAIIELVRRMIDDETGISLIAQGEQGASMTKTAQGMAMLMNSSNIMFRRVVKNFDDDLTTPCIRRAYHWNMQFSDKEDIKGDMEVDARGSSVLLVRELQATNLGNLLAMAQASPILGPMTKFPSTYRKFVQSLQISADDVVKTDEELEQAARKAAEQPPPPDPEMQKLELQKYIADRKYDAEMMKLAAQQNTDLDNIHAKMEEIRAKREEAEMKRQSDERRLAVELASREKTGVSAGGSI